MGPLQLGVNIDHVATLRQARYQQNHRSSLAEPSLLEAAQLCFLAGAHGLTVHLREDRRHIQDSDVDQLRAMAPLALNLEMANTPEMVANALRIRPEEACLVPEKRAEVTTEGGLDVAAATESLAQTVGSLRENGIVVSLFIDPDPVQIEASARIGASVVELHTGAFAEACIGDPSAELQRLCQAANMAHALGLRVNAGHGINYRNIQHILTIPHLHTLNIGHSIVSRAILTGLAQAVAEMLEAMRDYPHRKGTSL